MKSKKKLMNYTREENLYVTKYDGRQKNTIRSHTIMEQYSCRKNIRIFDVSDDIDRQT
jgi:hypothetical protein